MNRHRQRNNTSGYVGVSKNLQGKRNPWRAYVSINGKAKHLGTFKCRHKAAMIRDKEAEKLFGEFNKSQLADDFCCLTNSRPNL